MATPTPESAPEAGTQVTPTPAVSSPSAGQPPSSPANLPEITDALIDKLMAHPKFAGQLTRTVQSVKDKRFDQMERFKTYLDANGGDLQKAKREMVLDEMVSNYEPEPSGNGQPAQSSTTSLQSQTKELLDQFGIPDDDPELVAMAKNPYSDQFQWLRDVSA